MVLQEDSRKTRVHSRHTHHFLSMRQKTVKDRHNEAGVTKQKNGKKQLVSS